MTALQKPQDGVQAIVVDDFLRRLVARTLAQQLGPALDLHTSPFQFALSTKSGCECVAHIAQAMTDMDPNHVVVSGRDSSVRPDLAGIGSRRRRCCPAIRETIPWVPFHVLVDRRLGRHT